MLRTTNNNNGRLKRGPTIMVALKKTSEKLFKVRNFVAKACHKRQICLALHPLTTRDINIYVFSKFFEFNCFKDWIRRRRVKLFHVTACATWKVKPKFFKFVIRNPYLRHPYPSLFFCGLLYLFGVFLS